MSPFAQTVLGVIEVRHHPQGVERPERPDELGCDSHGERHRNARRQANGLDARDRAHGGDHAHQALGAHRHRIAAAEDDVANLGVGRDVRQRGGERLEGDRAAAVAHDPRSRTKPAVDAAAIGREQQRAIGVSLNEPRRSKIREFSLKVDVFRPINSVGL